MVGPRVKPSKSNFQGILDELVSIVDADADGQIAVGDIMARIGRRSYGPLLLFIGLFSISPATAVPGMTWLSAALTLIVALQMAIGMSRPWLPKGLTERTISGEGMKKGADGLRPWARRIDALLKPSLTFLSAPPFVNVVALVCVAAALITVPLGFIPLAPIVPGLAIVIIGLGLTARDGRILLLALAGVAAAVYFGWPLLKNIAERVMGMIA